MLTTGGETDLGIELLRGRGLRFVLVDQINRRGRMTVAEMVAALAEQGYQLAGRASKTISDALRWELARGRVVRLSRGVYAAGVTPPSTARRIRIFAERCEAWLVASMRSQQLPTTPPPPEHRRSEFKWRLYNSSNPPWYYLGWLWST